MSVVVLALLWLQSSADVWRGHLQVDPVVYHTRAVDFLDDGTWSNLESNEYQPGALWYFAAVGWFVGPGYDFHGFLAAFILSNLLLAALHLVVAGRFGGGASFWLMLGLLMAAGPILFYRFELLVSLMVLLCWVFWRKGHFVEAGFLLGVATATKVYPLLLVPLLLYSAWISTDARRAGFSLFSYACGVFLPLGMFGLWGGSWRDVLASLRFHFDKPFGIDGLLGTIVPIIHWGAGIPLSMHPRNGVYGFDPDLGQIPNFLFSWFWLPIFCVTLAVVLRRLDKTRLGDAAVLFTLLAVFVCFAKLMTPQYVWWAASLLPLASPGWFSRAEWIGLVFALLASLVIRQLVYPISYSRLIHCFPDNFLGEGVFWVNGFANLLLLVAVILAIKALLRHIQPCTSQG
jgi:hypothetical protein